MNTDPKFLLFKKDLRLTDVEKILDYAVIYSKSQQIAVDTLFVRMFAACKSLDDENRVVRVCNQYFRNRKRGHLKIE